MKKAMLLCAALAVVMMAQSAMAGTPTTQLPVVTTNNGLAVWWDVRNSATDNFTTMPIGSDNVFTRGQQLAYKKGGLILTTASNSGGPGDGQVLRISPRLPGYAVGKKGMHKPAVGKDDSIASLFRYATVEARSGVAEVISSLGSTIKITDPTPGSGNTFDPAVPPVLTPDPSFWSALGTATATTPVGANWEISAKAVMVPVAAGPVFSAAGGLVPSATPYKIGELVVTAGEWNKGNAAPANSNYELREEVNSLLITRTYDGAGPTPELPDFGYSTDTTNAAEYFTGGGAAVETGGTPEAATGDGSTIGSTSVWADADILVQMRGDFDNNGTVNSLDTTLFIGSQALQADGSLRQRKLYLGDMNANGAVNSLDTSRFIQMQLAASFSCPCP